MRSFRETTRNGTLKWLGRHLTRGFLLWEFQWCISWSHLTFFGAYCKTYVHSGAFMSHFDVLWYEWQFKKHYISTFYGTIFREKDTPRKFMMGRYQKLLAAKCPIKNWSSSLHVTSGPWVHLKATTYGARWKSHECPTRALSIPEVLPCLSDKNKIVPTQISSLYAFLTLAPSLDVHSAPCYLNFYAFYETPGCT